MKREWRERKRKWKEMVGKERWRNFAENVNFVGPCTHPPHG